MPSKTAECSGIVRFCARSLDVSTSGIRHHYFMFHEIEFVKHIHVKIPSILFLQFPLQ